jgi:fermentation-respiration switch protein FrsA (DUF1100 family)
MTTTDARRPSDERHAVASPPGTVPAVVDGTRLPVVDPGVREEVAFGSAGWRLAGHLYRPPGVPAGQPTPALAMAGPMTSVKEETLPHYAAPLARAGFTVLTFDSRNFGASAGPRPHHLDTYEQVEDLKNAVSYLLTRADVHADRVGLACVCLGAGYGLEVAALDRRVKVAALIAGGYDITDTYLDMLGPDCMAGYLADLGVMRQRHYATGEQQWIPPVAPPPAYGPSSMPIREAYEYYTSAHEREAPAWQNRLTYESMETLVGWNVLGHAHLVTQPLIVVHGTTDPLLPPRYAQQVHDQAASTDKQLTWITTHHHVELYDQDPYVGQALAAVVPFLTRTLAR